MITADTITDEQIREFRDSLPEVTDEEFRLGGAPHSPARWRRICHAALGAANARIERRLIADEINRVQMNEQLVQLRDEAWHTYALACVALGTDPQRPGRPPLEQQSAARARCAEILNARTKGAAR